MLLTRRCLSCLFTQGNRDLVLRDIKPNASLALLAIRLLAVASGNPAMRRSSIDQVQKWLEDGISSNNRTVRLVGAVLHSQDGAYTEALRCVQGATDLELMSLAVQIYLSMHRTDLAETELRRMVETEEDNTLTQLSLAWVSMRRSKAGVQEAYNIFQEFIDTNQASAKLSVGLAVCAMMQGQFVEAIACLNEARARDGDTVDVLANLAVCYASVPDSDEQRERVLRQLYALDASHPLAARLSAADQLFDAAAAKFAVA